MHDFSAPPRASSPPPSGAASLVRRFLDRPSPSAPALVIGLRGGVEPHAGADPEDILAIASRGVAVTAIDPAPAAVRALRERAAAAGLTIEARQESFLDFEPAGPTYGAVVACDLLSHLPRSGAARLLYRLLNWTAPGGLALLTAWHVDHPAYDLCQRDWLRAGLHSFRDAEGRHRTFMSRHEILDLLLGWEIVHHAEHMEPLERRGVVEAVAIKRASLEY